MVAVRPPAEWPARNTFLKAGEGGVGGVFAAAQCLHDLVGGVGLRPEAARQARRLVASRRSEPVDGYRDVALARLLVGVVVSP